MPNITTFQQERREKNRTCRRLAADRVLELAAYLLPVERALLEQFLGQGIKLETLAALHRVTPTHLSRKLHHLRDRLADPCFLLATQFSHRLPAALRPLARSFFRDGLTIRQCAVRHRLTLHATRRSLITLQYLLSMLKAEARNETFDHFEPDNEIEDLTAD